MSTKAHVRIVISGAAKGITSPGLVILERDRPSDRVRGLHKRFQRSDVESLRGDLSRVGQTMRDVIDAEKKASATGR